MSRGGLIALAALVAAGAAGCTVPNPRLCKNRPDCGVQDQSVPPDRAAPGDLSAADQRTPADAAPGLDGAAPADAGPDLLPCTDDRSCGAPGHGVYCDKMTGRCRPCTSDAHCGAACATCAAPKPVCRVDGTACTDCRMESQCAAGSYCSAETCQPCAAVDHCGPACSVCTKSAHPACVSADFGCGCVLPGDCGPGPNDTCSAGVCSRVCATSSDCTTAPNGTLCRVLEADPHCGCDNAASDCPTGATCNANHVCVCGSTVCRAGQMCKSGTCL